MTVKFYNKSIKHGKIYRKKKIKINKTRNIKNNTKKKIRKNTRKKIKKNTKKKRMKNLRQKGGIQILSDIEDDIRNLHNDFYGENKVSSDSLEFDKLSPIYN